MQASAPKVSVIIPCFNGRETLPRTLRAVTDQQGVEDFEILVVDSSNDGTEKLVEEQFPRVRLFHREEKTLPGAARNIGVQHSRAPLIAFTDADCVPPVDCARPGLLDIGMLPVPARLRDKWGDRPQPHSLSSLYGEVILSEGPLPPTPGTYVLGLQSKAKVFREFANVLHSQRGWDVVKLDSGHDFVSDAPDALALFLTEIADQHADY